MKEIGIKVLGAILVFITLFQPLNSRAVIVDALIAVVDDVAVSLSEVLSAGKVLQEVRARKFRVNEVIDYLIKMIIIEKETSKRGIKIEDEAVNSTVLAVAEKNNLSLREFKNMLAERGIDYETYRKVVKYEMLRQEYIRNFIQPRITVSRADVMEYYRNLKDEKLKPVNIVLISGDSFSELEKLRRLVKKGEMAVENLTDGVMQGVRVLKIENVFLSDLNQNLRNALKSLEPGGVSPVIDMGESKGFVIFKGYANNARLPEELYRRLEYMVFQRKVEEKLEEQIELTEVNHFVEIRRLKDCSEFIENVKKCLKNFSDKN